IEDLGWNVVASVPNEADGRERGALGPRSMIHELSQQRRWALKGCGLAGTLEQPRQVQRLHAALEQARAAHREEGEQVEHADAPRIARERVDDFSLREAERMGGFGDGSRHGLVAAQDSLGLPRAS